MAAALIPAAPALGSGGSGEGPDAELIELGRRYLDLVPVVAAADETYDRCCEAYYEPERPEALRHRMEDHVLGLHLPFIRSNLRNGLSADPSLNPFYIEDEVERLRYAPPPFDPAEIPVQRARIAEIEREHEAWLERCAAAEEEAGLDAAEAAVGEIVDQMRMLAKEIAAAPAKTIDGLRVRALILAGIGTFSNLGEGACTDQLMAHAIVRDLLSIEAA